MAKKKVTLAELFEPLPQPKPKTLEPKNFTLSPNDIARVEICPASRVMVGPKGKPEHSAWYGIFIHRFLEYVVTRGRAEAVRYIKTKNKRYSNVCERLDTKVIPDTAIAELNIGVNVITGAGEALEREFSSWKEHVLGRSDIAWCDEDGEWHVGDYKSGTKHKLVAKNNVQLMTLAVGLARMQEVEQVRGHIISVDSEQNKLTGFSNKEGFLYTKKILDRHYRRLQMAHMLTLETRAELAEEGSPPDYIPGDHCFGCRAREACGARALLEK